MKKRNKYYSGNVLSAQIPLEKSDRDSIIKWIYDIHIVEWYSTYLLKKEIDEELADKIQEIYLIICEIPDSRWQELYVQGQYAISAYVTGIIHQQLISDTSYIYREYEKRKTKEITKDELFWETYGEEH